MGVSEWRKEVSLPPCLTPRYCSIPRVSVGRKLNYGIWRRDPIFRLSKTRYNTASSLTGFVLKKDQKKEDKGSTITIEELIEKEVITFLWSIFLLFSNIYWCLFFFIQLGKQIHVPKATYMKGWVIDDDDDDDDFINAFLNKMFFTILN